MLRAVVTAAIASRFFSEKLDTEDRLRRYSNVPNFLCMDCLPNRMVSSVIAAISGVTLVFLTGVFGSEKPGWSEALETVSLPGANLDTSVPITTVLLLPITTTNLTAAEGYIGFQGDFTYDQTVCTFTSPVAVPAGLTGSGWTISGSILPGPGPIRTFRLSAFVNDGATPLSGAGTLLNLRMLRVSSTQGASTVLTWKPVPDNFVFINTDLDAVAPAQANGLITIGPACNLSEEFVTGASLPLWFMQNNSQPGPGTTGWFQGSTSAFPSHSGAGDSYLAANYQNGTGTSTLSNWLLTPQLFLQNGAQLTFWTRTVSVPVHPDRLQVRMSTNGASTNVGTLASDVGDFAVLLLDINPTYTTVGYPNVWTQFSVTLSGIASPTSGRLAFRYFVENGGPTGPNSDYIGIDSVIYVCSAPTPTPTPSPSPTPTPVSISGNTSYCSNPVPGPVPNVVLTLTGSASGTTLSNGAGNYQFSVSPGGTYTVTPTKTPLLSGSTGIDTVDVIAVQRHFTSCPARPETCLTGCRLTAADVNGDGNVTTVDVIAIQRFALGLSSGTANVGKYKFAPANRTYSGVGDDQTNQNYDTLIFGDVASHFVE